LEPDESEGSSAVRIEVVSKAPVFMDEMDGPVFVSRKDAAPWKESVPGTAAAVSIDEPVFVATFHRSAFDVAIDLISRDFNQLEFIESRLVGDDAAFFGSGPFWAFVDKWMSDAQRWKAVDPLVGSVADIATGSNLDFLEVKLGPDELRPTMAALLGGNGGCGGGVEEFSASECSSFLRIFDADGDGFLARDEFAQVKGQKKSCRSFCLIFFRCLN
jgi:hypothetical protein